MRVRFPTFCEVASWVKCNISGNILNTGSWDNSVLVSTDGSQGLLDCYIVTILPLILVESCNNLYSLRCL